MSQVLINQYLADLDRLKKVSGELREGIVSEAFKDLLKGWGRQHDLTFVPQFRLDTLTREKRYVDGALLHELRVPFGYWEAKDSHDDIDAEIAIKFRRGYPRDDIVFEDSTQAVLIQHGQEVMRCGVADVGALEKLLKLFFSHERPEIADFRKAVAQFKTDLPAVLKGLREMIEAQQASNPAFRKAATTFLAHAQEAINPALREADVREMLIQHILTEEIFAKVFDDSDYHRRNNVARELYKLEDTFFKRGLKSEPAAGGVPTGCIVVDSETVLAGVPAGARYYRLGNRSAIDWVLDQHKEKKPKDPTIREKFDTYRFADHKERMIDLLARVVRVSVETVALVQELKHGPR